MTTTVSARRRARLTAGVVAGIALVAVPAMASAHVHVDPSDAAAGGTTVLTFSSSHGCDASPTTGFTIDIPEGIAGIAPHAQAGWTIERVGADAGVPTQVVFSADEPIESGLLTTVSMQVTFADDLAGEQVAFPVLQECVDASTDWSQIADEGEDPHDLDSPAPLVTVGEPADDAHGGDHHDDADGAAQDATGSTDSTVLPIVLGAGGLALGAAGLAAGLVALRRTRRS
ncbi:MULTISPECIES: YcnI family protein [unclassified Microbacterium]|uniref:YcnI family copper-binding membrane protein n=1 Tax=unclassified Microbacterium TaxID=2609290 RepID=UPI00214B8B96|nr:MULTISPECIES: YcnI family protein [unclassified Microbacterium]MCR2785362.1 YcnI family protein [Microbacterium sp. zg.B96]MDL5353003.1 YcnI family protein [Microbacterium sp. zg-YB36]WIM16887.1 YcnI family protein [Microbacterium sp. zg-B96]